MAAYSTYPNNFARFYDVIYNQIRAGVDTAYFLSKIKESKGKVLEIGTGTGRFFIEARKAGADMYGIDNSEAMIEILKSKINASEHTRVRVADAVDVNLKMQFNLIIAPFRVLAHVITMEDQLRLLNNIHNHLVPEGLFIFDLFVPNLDLLSQGMDKVVDFEGEYEPGKKLRRITSMHADVVNQISYITMELEWETEPGKWEKEKWDLLLRTFFRYELEHLIARSKLEIVHIFGDYKESPLTRNSKDFVVLCKRK